MKKFLFCTVLALAAAFSSSAQQLTAVRQQEIHAFNGKGRYAMFIIRYHSSLKMAFTTNQGEELIKKNTTRKNGVWNETELTFDAAVARGGTLLCSEPNFLPVSITIALEANEVQVYLVDDPGFPDTKSCAEKNRLIGNKHFQQSNYSAARDDYSEALKCWTMEDGENSRQQSAERLASIDSLTKFVAAAKELEETDKFGKVKEIYDLYKSAYNINPDDMEIYKKTNEALQNYTTRCKELTINAEFYYNKRDWKKSRSLYESLILMGCSGSDEARASLDRITDEMNLLHHVVTYEYNSKATVGISSGNYHQRGTGGYFTFRFNPKGLETFRSDYNDSTRFEANMSFGWTLHTPLDVKNVFGLWMFFGPGATSVFNVNYQSMSETKFHPIFAISPEVGAMLKIRIAKKDVLALRYTYQYRYALKKAEEQYFGGTSNHVLGVGFCY